ncbi:UNVERIFIED_CONTAM: hypothetical protein HDU68_002810 [Siphonaria sp. JEL0065]|nr:hypothetical protein HDU68_002810 [Siphonaria sp. JEL0065]
MVNVLISLGTWGDLTPILAYAKSIAASDECTFLVATHSDLLARAVEALAPIHVETISLGTSTVTGDTLVESTALMDLAQRLKTGRAKPSLVICNLFSLCGTAIAELFCVPCFVVSAFVATDVARPSGFDEAFELCLASTGPHVSQLDRADVRHWAWRLFLADHGDFREQLGLHPWPHLLPLLVYAIPKVFIDLADTQLPASVSVASLSYQPKQPAEARQVLLRRHPQLARLLDYTESHRPIIHIGFGSMDSFHPTLAKEIDSVQVLVSNIARALEILNVSCLWVVNSSIDSLLFKILSQHQSTLQRMQFIQGPVSYPELFASGLVCASINHGGMGTITQVSMAGLKQVIVPFIFDQRKWGERLAGIGVAKVVSEEFAEDVEIGEWAFLIRWLVDDTAQGNNNRIQEWKNRVLEGIIV